MHQARTSISRTWICGAILGIGAVLAAHGAAAQNNPPRPSAGPPATPAAPHEVRSTPLPAPVGHRQVKPSDLPPDAVKNENKAEQGLRDFDAKLRICKGC
jgi:hypothetical protein